MKAEGPRYERETLIGLNDDGDTAWIWTASDTIYRRMLKRGWRPEVDGERHAEFIVPKSAIRLPRQKRAAPTKPRGFARKRQEVAGA